MAAVAAGRAPNIVLILADDLGYGDLGCYGSTQNTTPHLDRLAGDGCRLTHHYSAAPVCSPARAALLTGCVPERTGVTGVLRGGGDEGLALELPTLAAALRAKGYETALIGKWHLGMGPAHVPLARGFDSFWGFLTGTIDYYTHASLGGGPRGPRATFDGLEPVQLDGYYPELAAERAVSWIGRPHARPFFLYLSLALPHTPLQAPDRWTAPFRKMFPEANALYAGMVACLDDTVGRVRAALEAAGEWERTIVVFASDNGWVKMRTPAVAGAGSNGALRGGKYELYEGGIRVPCIVRWPGVTRAGTECREISWFPDWFATLTGEKARDGVDLRAALRGKRLRARRLRWQFQDDLVGTPFSVAVRDGRWKYLRTGAEEALYDLERDPGERVNLREREPAVFRRLR